MSEQNIFELETQRKKLDKDNQAKRQRKITDLRKILKEPEGRRYIRSLLEEAGIWRSSFTLNSNQTAFNEGQRNLGLGIIIDLEQADPNIFAQMQREYLSERISEENKRKKEQEEETDE